MPKAIAASLKLISILQPVLLSAILGFKLGENVTGALLMEMKDVTFWCDMHKCFMVDQKLKSHTKTICYKLPWSNTLTDRP